MSFNIEDKENLAISARGKAWELYQTTEGWTQVKTNIEGDAVLEWRTPDSHYVRDDGATTASPPAWKCWRLKASIEASPETVISVLMDYDNMEQWNPALSKTQVKTENKTSQTSTDDKVDIINNLKNVFKKWNLFSFVNYSLSSLTSLKKTKAGESRKGWSFVTINYGCWRHTTHP